MSSKTGQNIRYMMDKHKLGYISKLVAEKNNLKNLRVYSLPEEEEWKVSLMREIALLRKGQLEMDFDDKDLEDILENVCTS